MPEDNPTLPVSERIAILETTRRFYETSYIHPLVLFAALVSLYLGSIAAIGLWQSWLGKLASGVVLSIAAGKLFVAGHDACHGSFTPSRKLNRTLGRMALTAAYHLPAAWRFWHNVVHHTYTNDLSRDFVWRPLSGPEFATMSPRRRGLERLYRHHSGFGLGINYFIEILLPKMLTVPISDTSVRQQNVRAEASLFYIFHVVVVCWLIAGRSVIGEPWPTGGEIAVSLTCGFIGPLLYTCYAIGFVVYFNHTHPEIRWHHSKTGGFVDHQISSTLYLKFRGIAEFVLPSDIMSHVAHHLDTKIPVRHLPEAQECLVRLTGLQIKTEVWSWSFHSRVMRSCKLYDSDQHLWVGFDGTKDEAD